MKELSPMDLSSPRSSPGAPPSTSLTPAPTPGPAATAILSPSPAPGASTTTPNRSSLGSPCVSVGRSKAQRWSDSSPASGQSGDARPSFLEALLTGTNLVRGGTTISTRNCDAPAAVSSPAPAAAARPNEAHRPVVFRGAKGSVMVASQASASATVQSVSHPPISSLVPDSARPTSRPQRNGSVFWRRAGGDFQPAAERQRFVKLRWASQLDPHGWRKCHSGRGHRRRQRPVQVRRRVPTDLDGRCFNCFSTAHSAAQCRQGPRCFRCREIGHRSYTCPGAQRCLPQRRLVWRPVASSTLPANAPSQWSSPASAGRAVGGTAPSQRSSPAIMEQCATDSLVGHVLAMSTTTTTATTTTSDQLIERDAGQGSGRRRRR